MDDFVGRKEAASILGVTTRTLSDWTSRGLVSPIMVRGNRHQLMYRKSDLQMLRLAREDKSVDIWHVKALALQALVTARSTEQRLLRVLEHLGLDIMPLERDEASVRALYKDAGAEVTTAQLRDVAWVRFWGSAFFGMDETYFELVELTEGDDEPWRRFMNFANSVLRVALKPGTAVDEAIRASDELRLAYRYFQAGKQHLWYVSYMFCRREYGQRVADKVFNGAQGAVDELIAILH